GQLAGLTLREARQKVIALLETQDLILDRQPTCQSVRVHERCDTPVEYLQVEQWFVGLLAHKEALQQLGEGVAWRPTHMSARYQAWVENLNWDWCLSRQRYYGVPIPVWYCDGCGAVIPAEREQLPLDPLSAQPLRPCPQCAGQSFTPESDVLDTWATSSLSPQIVGGWLDDENLYRQVFPFSLRPQAHEIIRTWAFYTLVKSHFHFQTLPWQDVAISGWGIAGEGMGKISKSRGGGPMAPMEMIEKYSADAVRYWAASTGPGKDAVISEEKIQTGARLATKLWHVARFAERFLRLLPADSSLMPDIDTRSLADRWILARLGRLVERATELLLQYDYAAAKAEIEAFFWRELADNYLEMCKQRLYAGSGSGWHAACATLHALLLTTLKLFAPFLPYVTEAIYQELFAAQDGCVSIHRSPWPEVQPSWLDQDAEDLGAVLVSVATAVRRYKSEGSLSLGTELTQVQLAGEGTAGLAPAVEDLMSITRAREIKLVKTISPGLHIEEMEGLQIGIRR
ncbi:MAG: class I tRNA ligase family protein, partial [Anaerolineales bacterium]|nr:class I tRNA ligase family protein [Anaerolineales bacterium]